MSYIYKSGDLLTLSCGSGERDEVLRIFRQLGLWQLKNLKNQSTNLQIKYSEKQTALEINSNSNKKEEMKILLKTLTIILSIGPISSCYKVDKFDIFFESVRDNTKSELLLNEFKNLPFDSAVINSKKFDTIFVSAVKESFKDPKMEANFINICKENGIALYGSKNKYVFVGAFHDWLNGKKVNISVLKPRVFKLLDSLGTYY